MAATRKEATAFVRFQLEQLRTRNGFAEFEHLCRHFARARIDPSVIPATGPVARGGDQGRDFESLVLLTDTGLDERKVFACTLQQRDLGGKIRHDLASIVKGRPVRVVYVFCVIDVQVAERHLWQGWAHAEYGVELEVVDAQALSEHLVEPDLTWIAEECLGVSRDLLPAIVGVDERYAALLAEWRDSRRRIDTLADFLAVRHCVRLTTRGVEQNDVDGPRWLRLTSEFAARVGASSPLWRSAAYEVVVGTFYLRRSIVGMEPIVSGYLVGLPGDALELLPGDLLDGLTVLNCASIQWRRGGFALGSQFLSERRSHIESLCASALAVEERPSARCELLSVCALLAAFRPGSEDPPDFAAAVRYWQQLAEVAREARMYNVKALADALTQFVPHLHADPGFSEVLARLDDIVAERIGAGAKGELARQRACSLVESGQYVPALRELHQAARALFRRETMGDLVDVLRHISVLYEALDLHAAALYYAQAAVVVVANTNDVRLLTIVPTLLHEIASSKSALGHTIEFLARAELALASDPTLVPDERVEHLLAEYVAAFAMVDFHDPRLAKRVRGRWSKHPMRASFEANLAPARAAVREVVASGESFGASRFVDCADECSIMWNALGADWSVSYKNDATNVLAGEFIACCLQVVHADIVSDPVLVAAPSVRIEVVVARSDVEFSVTRTQSAFRVIVGSEWWSLEPAEMAADVLAVAARVCMHRTVLSAIEKSLERGLVSKLIVGGPYPSLRAGTVGAAWPMPARDSRLRKACVRIAPRGQPRLDGPAGRLPGHSGEEWDRAIAERYVMWEHMFAPAISRLAKTEPVARAARRWRHAGRSYWHIVGAIGSLAFTLYGRERGVVASGVRDVDVAQFMEETPRHADVRLDDVELTESMLDSCLEGYLGAFLAHEDIELDPARWDRDRDHYRKLADERLGFSEPGPVPPDWILNLFGTEPGDGFEP